MSMVFEVRGMSCEHCVATITSAVARLPGVIAVDVDLADAVVRVDGTPDWAAVATAIEVQLKSGKVSAEGDLDFRGTLAVDKEAPVGFREIRVRFDLETDADPATSAKLIELTERYCVVLQSLATPTVVTFRNS